MDKKSNHLLSEKSPYLLAHAFNPVSWYPWGDEAFKKALLEDKPVFLSIGYSTCHWCHVMEKESFDDVQVAKLLNETFVCIKVDREERPDIDKIYMNFCQMLTGTGGWPLTIIMTPEKKPFFAGTYIPKNNKYGRVGMLELIGQVKELWLNKRIDILKSSESISKHFLSQVIFDPGKTLDASILDQTFDQLSRIYDKKNGGFGQSPKFPTMHHLNFLLRYWKRTKNEDALEMVEKTINAMKDGGIYDHIGFGFHRYSTDANWIILHFEKMLYDQALISIGCIETYQATKNERYKSIAQEIFTYVLRDMTSDRGGFYSAEDADSEGVEGKYYVWTKETIKKIFTEKEADIFIELFNIGASNLEDGSILHISRPLEFIASKHKLSLADLNAFIAISKKKLFDERIKRVHPFKDDKILTDLNGLMISALAIGARVFNKEEYKKSALSSAEFILNNLITKDGNLLHRYRDGQSAIPANLDDYAFFIMGLLELYESTFNISYLKTALKLNKYLLENFWDSKGGGFYFTQTGSELSEFRQKDIYDGAIPSGNSVSVMNMLRLSRITANTSLEDKAMQIVKTFSGTVKKNPVAYTQFISSFDFIAGQSYEIVIVGDIESKETKRILNSLNTAFIPSKVIILKPPKLTGPEITEMPDFIKDLKMTDNKPAIYVCSNYSCNLPVTDIDEMLKLLK